MLSTHLGTEHSFSHFIQTVPEWLFDEYAPERKLQLLTALNTPFKKYCLVCTPLVFSGSSKVLSKGINKPLTSIPDTFPCTRKVKIQALLKRERDDFHLLEAAERAHKQQASSSLILRSAYNNV